MRSSEEYVIERVVGWMWTGEEGKEERRGGGWTMSMWSRVRRNYRAKIHKTGMCGSDLTDT